MSEVVILSVPDKKEAIYIDGKLILEDKWISCTQLLDKLVQWGVIHGGRRYAEETALNDVGQFPRTLAEMKTRDKRYA
jgi:hypothetical protein